jgi:hypothetical protein
VSVPKSVITKIRVLTVKLIITITETDKNRDHVMNILIELGIRQTVVSLDVKHASLPQIDSKQQRLSTFGDIILVSNHYSVDPRSLVFSQEHIHCETPQVPPALSDGHDEDTSS